MPCKSHCQRANSIFLDHGLTCAIQNNPTILKLKNEDGKVYSIKVSLKYVPVRMQLDPSESINNMGLLRVDVLDAQNLPSADSNGKSDPYVKFEFNGQEVFKSKTQKKTLNPTWNEFFELPVPSRTAATFKATVWDWDFADKPDFLGAADINLGQLEPFRAQELRLNLDGKSGMLRLRLLFRPDYVTRTRQGTSTLVGTFSVPGKIVTGVAGVPLKGGAAVAGVVGHGVGKGASFIKRGFRSNTKREEDSDTNSSVELPTIVTNGPEAASGGLKRSAVITEADGSAANELHHARTRSVGASSVRSAFPGASSGTASFTVVSAAGYPPSTDMYVTITQMRDGKSKAVGKTKHRKSSSGTVKFDETFSVQCTPDSQFKVEAKEHHTFGSDDPLGESVYFVDESNSGQEKALKVGSGTVYLKSGFVPSESAPQDASSTLSPADQSPKSSSLRRSFLSKGARSPSRDGP